MYEGNFDYAADHFNETNDELNGFGDYYCDICNVSCAGPQPYQTHLSGKKHLRKLGMQNTGANPAAAQGMFWCHVCNVPCTGQANYDAHLQGSKHQKALTLQSTMGMSSTASKHLPLPMSHNISPRTEQSAENSIDFMPDGDAEAVGREYAEEITVGGCGLSNRVYYCKLCDCRCNDGTSLEQHLRGRPHRLQYKKIVDHELDVDAHTQLTPRQAQEKFRQEFIRRRQSELWNIRATCRSKLMPPTPDCVMIQLEGPQPMFGVFAYDNKDLTEADSADDLLIRTKYAMLCPAREEINAITAVVEDVESALKNIADGYLEERKAIGTFWTDSSASSGWIMHGVVRVGAFGKGILLRGEREAELVVVCDRQLTDFDVRKVCEPLNAELKGLTKHRYEVCWAPVDCVLKVSTVITPKISILLWFTSSELRNPDAKMPSQAATHDLLDTDKCLDALAALRGRKWFDARCVDKENFTMMVRLIRDFCHRLNAWKPLKTWPAILLIQKAICTAGVRLSILEAFRRILEAMASGILLSDAPGLMDPCQSDIVDALRDMSNQERDDITASAQRMLRMMAFGKLNEILGIEKYDARRNGSDQSRPKRARFE